MRTTIEAVMMFPTFRNAALAVITAGLALTSPARATVLVDYNFTDFGIHVQFDTPTLLPSDTTSTFTLDNGGVTEFQYALPGSGGSCPLDIGFSAPCDAFLSPGNPTVTGGSSILISTGNPNVFTDFNGGTLTFTQLAAAVPEPGPLTVLAMGLAGLGMVLRTRRA
jgi:hypothetical protein